MPGVGVGVSVLGAVFPRSVANRSLILGSEASWVTSITSPAGVLRLEDGDSAESAVVSKRV